MNIPLNIDWQQILLHMLNFTILALGLFLVLYNPVKKFMQKRKEYYEEIEKKPLRPRKMPGTLKMNISSFLKMPKRK